MDRCWPARRLQRKNALVSRAPGTPGRGFARADRRRPGSDRRSLLGLALRIHRSGSHLRRTHRPLPDGLDARKNALESTAPLRDRSSSFATIRANSVTICRALETPRCHNGSMNFDTLARQHKDAVYRQMIRVCGNREDAEDVLIEALLKAYRHLDQLRESAAFRAWLAQIAKRVCWQLKERESLLPLLQLSALEDEGRELAGADPAPDVQLARKEMKHLLQQAIDALPGIYRPVYELSDVENVRCDQVANRLGISKAAMKSRLHRARDLVRNYLDAALSRQALK